MNTILPNVRKGVLVSLYGQSTGRAAFAPRDQRKEDRAAGQRQAQSQVDRVGGFEQPCEWIDLCGGVVVVVKAV